MNDKTELQLIGITNPDGSIQARGWITSKAVVLPVDCVFPAGSFQEQTRRPRGRPRGKKPETVARDIAVLAHMRMAAHKWPKWSKTARADRLASDIWHTNTDYRTFAEWVKSGLAATSGGAGHLLIVPEETEGRFSWFAFGSHEPFHMKDRQLSHIEGLGWFCQWGMKKAIYGLIRSKT